MNYSTFIKEKLVSLINEMDQYREMAEAGLPEPEYKQSESLPYWYKLQDYTAGW